MSQFNNYNYNNDYDYDYNYEDYSDVNDDDNYGGNSGEAEYYPSVMNVNNNNNNFYDDDGDDNSGYDDYYPSVININNNNNNNYPDLMEDNNNTGAYPYLLDENIMDIYQFGDDTQSLSRVCKVNKATQNHCAGEQFWKPVLLRNNIILPEKPFTTMNEWLAYFDFGKKVNKKVNNLFKEEHIRFKLNIPIDKVMYVFTMYGVDDVIYGAHAYFTKNVNFVAIRANIHFGNNDPDNIYQVEINAPTKSIIYKLDIQVLKQILIYFYMNRFVIA